MYDGSKGQLLDFSSNTRFSSGYKNEQITWKILSASIYLLNPFNPVFFVILRFVYSKKLAQNSV